MLVEVINGKGCVQRNPEFALVEAVNSVMIVIYVTLHYL